MLDTVVLCKEDALSLELSGIISGIPRIFSHFFTDIDSVKEHLREHNASLLIVAVGQKVNYKSILELNRIYPQIHFLYYYPQLSINNLQYTEFHTFSHIIIGENRAACLSDILVTITKSHWKKIPYSKFNLAYDDLSPRLKKVMNYIETHELKECSTSKIARYLDISPGYFSQEFKREVRTTFRSFMQALLDHYEYLIFDRLDLSAKAASQILGYSELSSFSRSFKKRKGYPPSHQKNHILVKSGS